MKLLFCDECFDVFKLAMEVRSCHCGRCRGRYLEDGHHAETNGKGINIALDNRELLPACSEQILNPSKGYSEKKYHFTAWVRGHDGPSNPRSVVNVDL